VYDANGRKVRTLLDGSQPSGEHFIKWDGMDDLGNRVSSGAYLYSLNFNGKVISRKMLKVE